MMLSIMLHSSVEKAASSRPVSAMLSWSLLLIGIRVRKLVAARVEDCTRHYSWSVNRVSKGTP